MAYAATKSIAQETAETFLKIQPRTFDLVVLMPSFVLGADPLVKNLGGLMVGSNGILMNHLPGQRMAPMIKTSIHIDDVAKLHVQALDLLIPAGRYLVSSGGLEGTNWVGAFAIMEKRFPGKVGKDFVKGGDQVSFVDMSMDTEKVEKAFRIQFRNFEKQMKDVAGNYLDLRGGELVLMCVMLIMFKGQRMDCVLAFLTSSRDRVVLVISPTFIFSRLHCALLCKRKVTNACQ